MIEFSSSNLKFGVIESMFVFVVMFQNVEYLWKKANEMIPWQIKETSPVAPIEQNQKY